MIPAIPHPGSAAAGAIIVCLLALGFIGLLPRIFFRRGRLNASWWLTAAPFAVAGLALVGGLLGWLVPSGGGSDSAPGGMVAGHVGVVTACAAIVLACAAIALIGFTLGSHARPVSLWHQENDRPERLVMTGAYARIRHPFYAAFLLTLLACVLAMPHALTALALVA